MDFVVFKTALAQRRLTQLELARKLAWPASRISLILHGYRVVTENEARHLSRVLGVDVDALFPETKN